MANPFVHVELMTSDVQKAKSFYSRLFRWQLEEMEGSPAGAYTLIKVGEGTGGGMMKDPRPGATSAWMPYVLVDNVDDSTREAESLGAKVMKPVDEVPNMGRFSIITDPTGAMLGLWEPRMREGAR
jgi:predicted enzyme related to lactoylglutathione lyase